MDETSPTASQALRRFTLGSGPLKRTSDRVEFLARVLLVCVLLMAVPIALVVASVTHAQGLVDATAQALDRHQVDARVVTDPPLLSDLADVPQTARAPAVWRGPSGQEERGLVQVPIGARAGSTVSIWVDQDGNLTSRPLDSSDATARAVGTAIGTFLLICALAVAFHMCLLTALERSRLRRWGADWLAVEPVWRRTTP